MTEDKLLSLSEAARLVQDGQMLALGGNSLTRSPAAFVRELARQGRRGLRLVKTAGAYEVDLLCAAGAVAEVHAGYVGFENLFGLAAAYRSGVEEGRVRAVEHACSTVIAGMRASAYGLPSQPAPGLQGADTPALSDFREVEDPNTGERVYMIPRIRPDWAVIHVQHADAGGNARIDGGAFEDVLMTRAAEGVILTAERIVETAFLAERPERTEIPAFLVRAVVPAPGGAAPGSCFSLYDTDEAAVGAYIEAAAAPGGLDAHLAEWEERDRRPAKAARGARP
ncbi:MAG: CoA-transferase [bacterium]